MFSVFNKGIFMLSFFVCYQKWKTKQTTTTKNHMITTPLAAKM